MKLEFENCCYCINLKFGCLIIAFLDLISDFRTIVWCIQGLGRASDVTPQIREENMQALRNMKAVFVIMLLGALVGLIFTIVLILGIIKKKRGYVKASLIYMVITLVLLTIAIFASFDFVMVSVNLITILLNIYFFLVIRSYYLKMEDPVNKPAVYNTA